MPLVLAVITEIFGIEGSPKTHYALLFANLGSIAVFLAGCCFMTAGYTSASDTEAADDLYYFAPAVLELICVVVCFIITTRATHPPNFRTWGENVGVWATNVADRCEATALKVQPW